LINKRIFFIPALLFLVLIYSCSDSPTSIGNNLLAPDYLSVHTIDSYQDSIGQTSTYYKTPIRLSDSPRLLVGKFENIESSSLMRFAVVLPDTIKEAFLNSSLNIIDAKIELTKVYNIGNDAAPINFSVHFINSGWTSYGFTADSIPNLSYDDADIGSNYSNTDSLYTFNIDEPTINKWFQTASDTSFHNNRGIYIKPDPASVQIVGFGAYNISLLGIPKLNVIVETAGITDTLSFFSIEDVSAVQGDKPSVPAEDIAVQGVLAVNGRIKFDLSSLPSKALINKAQLTVFIDSSATKTGTPFTNSLVSYFAIDTTVNSYDTTSAIVLNRHDNYFTGDIATFIQSIKSGFHENNGIVLSAGNQNLGVDIFALKGSDASDTALRPRLVITYTGRK
jgi:hypothetical protein